MFVSIKLFPHFLGKSVDELTEFCKKLSNGESNGYLSNISGGESDVDADLEKPFHHPFVIKDRGPIVMNIKVRTIKHHYSSSRLIANISTLLKELYTDTSKNR